MNEITEDIVRGAAKKLPAARTTAQLPVYRAAANVLFVLTQVVAHAPRKLVRLTDRVLEQGSGLCMYIAVANETRGEERRSYIGMALACCVVIKSFAVILQKQNVMSGQQLDRLKKLLKNTTAQLAGWRESTKIQGS